MGVMGGRKDGATFRRYICHPLCCNTFNRICAGGCRTRCAWLSRYQPLVYNWLWTKEENICIFGIPQMEVGSNETWIWTWIDGLYLVFNSPQHISIKFLLQAVRGVYNGTSRRSALLCSWREHFNYGPCAITRYRCCWHWIYTRGDFSIF